MPIDVNVEITVDELVQIVGSVFETMLSIESRASTEHWRPSADRLISSVHLTGAWNGAVLVECSNQQACHFAGRFLSIDAPEAVDDVVRDVLGELANMIGGNLKCALKPGIQLSMPSVVDGSSYHLRVCGMEVRERLAFECSEGAFWVTVIARNDQPPDF